MMDDRTKEPFPDHRKREVFALVKMGDLQKDKWVRCGIGFVNQDQSLTILLDTLPVGGKLAVREWESREQREARFARRGASVPFGGPVSDVQFSENA